MIIWLRPNLLMGARAMLVDSLLILIRDREEGMRLGWLHYCLVFNGHVITRLGNQIPIRRFEEESRYPGRCCDV